MFYMLYVISADFWFYMALKDYLDNRFYLKLIQYWVKNL